MATHALVGHDKTSIKLNISTYDLVAMFICMMNNWITKKCRQIVMADSYQVFAMAFQLKMPCFNGGYNSFAMAQSKTECICYKNMETIIHVSQYL